MPAAKAGDIVKVNYILKLENGSVIDTNIQSIAEESGIYNAQRKYEPIQITVNSSQVIPGFDKALIGMREGQTKTITVQPAEAYGEWNIENVANISRTFEYNRTISTDISPVPIPLDAFKEHFGVEAKKGDIVKDAQSGYDIKVLDTNEENATVVVAYHVGQVIQVPTTGFNATVISVGTNKVTFRQDPPETAEKQYGTVTYEVTPTKIIETLDVQVGESVSIGTVTEVTDDNVLIDMNHPLAGKTLTFTITMVNVMKPAA
jgi:FKBP-type peptidyl-prolyl cis-trans isomerase 2